MNKPKNSGGYRFISRQRKRTLRRRGESVYYDITTGFFIWRTSMTDQIDHRIPLKRGGLDNASNFVLAHKTCNHARGHDMPEVKNRKAATDDGCLINHCEEIK